MVFCRFYTSILLIENDFAVFTFAFLYICINLNVLFFAKVSVKTVYRGFSSFHILVTWPPLVPWQVLYY